MYTNNLNYFEKNASSFEDKFHPADKVCAQMKSIAVLKGKS
jgi:hypothetical protein